MQEIKVKELTPHPKNEYFFDDMMGQKWKEFIESIKTSGVIEPIVITQNKVIVSGHQRVRACKELGIDKVMADIRIYEDEDKIIKDLLETNIRQRGDVSSSSLKMGRIICELERIYKITNGGKGSNRFVQLSTMSKAVQETNQENIYSQLGISKDTYHNYKKLTTLIPELQELVDDKISPSVASRVIAKLSPTEQEELLKSLPTTEKLTQKQVQEYIDKLKEKDNQIAGYEIKLSQLQPLKNEIKELEQRIITISSQKNKTEIVTQEVDRKETLNTLSDLRKQLENKNIEYRKLYEKMIENEKLLSKAMGESTNWQLTSHCSEITKKMLDFVNDMGKYGYMAEAFNDIPIATRVEYVRCIGAVKIWADNILNTINNKKNTFEIKGEEI